MKPANFLIVQDLPDRLVIKDIGPWDQFPTVTNDVEQVVARLQFRLAGRRLFYYDSYGQFDEILVKKGEFAGFRPG